MEVCFLYLQNSSSSDSSGSDWECSGNKPSAAHKPHFSVTSCDTGLKLKIAAIPRKAPTKQKSPKAVKKKNDSENPEKPAKEKPGGKKKAQLTDSSSSSESCSKCSSDSSSDDDVPLKTVSKGLMSKSVQKNAKSKKSDSEEERRCGDKDSAPKVNSKDKQSATKTTVKKTKDEPPPETTVKRGRGRPRTKVSYLCMFYYTIGEIIPDFETISCSQLGLSVRVA